MRVAIGFKSHSGWAASVCIGAARRGFEIVDRRRIELTPEGEIWAKQPYHSAEELELVEAGKLVKAGIKSAHAVAHRAVNKLAEHFHSLGYELAGCGVLIPEPMPEWSIDEILAVHFRMHKAEGVLFPEALCKAVEKVDIACVTVPEKRLREIALQTVGKSYDTLLAEMGKLAGPPWAKDQRNAALAAMIVLGRPI
jgi:hypothetical protein